MTLKHKLVLASRSPRRQEILGRFGVPFETAPADIDETPLKGEKPREYCVRIARSKAQKVHEDQPEALVLAADTPVILGRKILQSAFSAEACRAMFAQLSGRRVYVPTAICLIQPDGTVLEDYAQSWLKFKPLTATEIETHVQRQDDWHGASGAFKIQDSLVESMVVQLHGSLTGIMGLPLYETAKLLRRAGVNV